ncbi:MAG: SusD/RagB family nutrient-binding outer membrane lipoprotein, partial [Bacteroidia bacterium]|nr:SusD/RagB family nutrient-binding outer membrane lipoprotein [Bacteroidia bacterium]
MQLSYRAAQITFSDNAAALTRIDYFFGRDYFANLGSGTLNGPWGNLYSAMLPDIANIEILNTEDTDLSFHLGISKTMQAHLMMQLVDFLGDIPWSEANNPSEFPTPMLDDDE